MVAGGETVVVDVSANDVSVVGVDDGGGKSGVTIGGP